MELRVTDETNPDFLRLIGRLDQEYYDKFGEIALRYREFNNINDSYVVVLAIEEGIAIGCGSFKELDSKSVEIKRVFIEKAYRQRGIATEIIEKLEGIAIEKGYEYGVLETGADNVPAIKTYEKLGYSLMENFGFLKDDNLCISMKKDLRRF